jgi:phthalate 4,5-dioxygenase oxygenase subunit
VPSGPGESSVFKAWQPIDDYSCYTFYVHYDPRRALEPERIHANWGHQTSAPDYRVPNRVDNMHLQDRASMERNISGIVGAAVQDIAMQESMGALYDRSQEHLGSSDRGVVFYRRLMLKLIRDAEAGLPLPGQDPELDYSLRGVSCDMPKDRPWQEAAVWLDRQEKQLLAAE